MSFRGWHGYLHVDNLHRDLLTAFPWTWLSRNILHSSWSSKTVFHNTPAKIDVNQPDQRWQTFYFFVCFFRKRFARLCATNSRTNRLVGSAIKIALRLRAMLLIFLRGAVKWAQTLIIKNTMKKKMEKVLFSVLYEFFEVPYRCDSLARVWK